MPLYIDIIKEAYEAKRLKNPLFSMNAYAKYLGLSPSQYNEVLKGKCGFSDQRALNVTQKLGLPDLQKRLFCLSVMAEHAREKAKKESARLELNKLQLDKVTQLQLETFAMVSSWYYFAILELIDVDDFKPNERWIAKRLNVDVDLIKKAVNVLKSLGLIVVKSGSWQRSGDVIRTTNDIPSVCIQKFHSQILSKAESAVFNIPVEEREYRSTFMAIDSSLIPDLKRKIRKFKEAILREATIKSKKKDVMMALNIQMFPVDHRS